MLYLRGSRGKHIVTTHRHVLTHLQDIGDELHSCHDIVNDQLRVAIAVVVGQLEASVGHSTARVVGGLQGIDDATKSTQPSLHTHSAANAGIATNRVVAVDSDIATDVDILLEGDVTLCRVVVLLRQAVGFYIRRCHHQCLAINVFLVGATRGHARQFVLITAQTDVLEPAVGSHHDALQERHGLHHR